MSFMQICALTAIGAAGLLTACGNSSSSSSHAGSAGAATTVAKAAPSQPPAPRGTGQRGDAKVPILMYHVINSAVAHVRYPGLYVPTPEFAAQMQALKAAGWHAVTMDQLRANWTRGVPLPSKPIVLSFDNGYASQYTNALPVLKSLGWVGVENMQLSGLPPSQGGLTDAQIRGLLSAGWELDTQGISHAELTSLDSTHLHYEIATGRQLLRRRYGVAVNWFCYPSGHYDATVIAAVKAAGYVGSTTVVPGWASRTDDPYALPRLRVLGGTSPSGLLVQIATAQRATPPPAQYRPGQG